MQQDSDVRRSHRVCPACGRLTPAQNARCVECGQASAQALAEEIDRANERRFARRFFGSGTPATWAIIGANIGVFVLMASIARTVNPGTTEYMQVLLSFGAKVNSLIRQGEYWRFVTPMFIHIGLMHLLVNMYSLYAIGPSVERLYGTARFVSMYVLCGIGGVAASYYFVGNNGVSAGASGALFGLLGILLVFGLRWNHELPGVFRKAFSPRQFLPVLALNLLITFALPFIDKWAHLGGLAVGALLAAVVPYKRSDDRRSDRIWWPLALVCVLAVVGSFGYVFANFRPPSAIASFIASYNAINTAMDDAASAVGRASDGQAVLPEAAESASKSAATARGGRGLDAESGRLLQDEAALLDKAAAMLRDPATRPSHDDAEQFQSEVHRVSVEWDAWLERRGEAYGISKKNDDSRESGGSDGD